MGRPANPLWDGASNQSLQLIFEVLAAIKKHAEDKKAKCD